MFYTVDKEIVLETIKKMYESGIDDEVVHQTLKDIGLSQAEIRQYIAEAKGVAHKPISPKTSPEPKPFESRRAAAKEKPNQAAMHTTTHVALEQQAAKTSELLEKIGVLEKRLRVVSTAEKMPESLASINQRLAAMEGKLRELKAELAATKTIMEKILETDRKVLNKL